MLLLTEASCTVPLSNFIFIDNSVVESPIPVFFSNIFLDLLRLENSLSRLTSSFEVLPDKCDYYLC